MLPIEALKKTNFSDGMIFNPSQIKTNDEYVSFKLSLLSRYAAGKGILVGFLDNLNVSIEKGNMYINPGAAIDENGDLIFVDKKTPILKDLQTSSFTDKKSIHIYLKYNENLEDFKSSRNDDDEKLYYKIAESFTIEVRAKALDDKELFEVARVYIEHDSSNNISEAINPYSPMENEIDIRFSSKIVPANSMISISESIMVTNVIRKYADFLTEMSYVKSIFTASIAASFSNKVVAELKMEDITAWKLYGLLSHLLHVSSKIKDEKSEIVNTGFWKNILRLQNLFSFSERFDANYYDIMLNKENSFFSKVLLHFSNASIFDGNWDELSQNQNSNIDGNKGYYIAGSSTDCDLLIEGDDIEKEHARIYPFKDSFLIEDISHSSGIYINAMRLESGVKKLIKNQDFVTLGKNGKVVNLNDLKGR